MLVVVATLPAFAVLLSFQQELRDERGAQARTIANEQVELVSEVLSGVFAAGRQGLAAAGQIYADMPPGEACDAQLDRLRAELPSYSLLALVQQDGSLICSSSTQPIASGALSLVMPPLADIGGFTVGQFAAIPGLGEPVLVLGLPARRDGGAAVKPAAVIVAGLDLGWLNHRIADLRQPTGAAIIVADRAGMVLARTPENRAVVGTMLAQPLRPLIAETQRGTRIIRDDRGRQRVVGYSPPAFERLGLYVGAGFDVADLTSGIDRATMRGYLLIALGAAVVLLLALLVGHRALRMPAAVLLQAARRWSDGEWEVRAHMPAAAAAEFGALSRAFNDMAEIHQHQRGELQSLNEALELRVADRTRALLESNNRLQVEIAERELTEANLRQAQKLQALGQLAGGIAHEFNNLLTAVLGSVELLRKWLTEADSRQLRQLESVAHCVERGSRLTSQLLAFSRKQSLLAVPLDVAEAIQGMQGLLATTLGPSVQIEVRTDPGLWPAMLDPNQFEAAILNLALNARDAMPDGGRLTITANNLAVTPARALPDWPEGDYVCLIVMDSGTGMSPEVISRAFEPFFTTKALGSGSGLGLSQVHGMVRQSGGTVSIDSRPGSGTKITILLPRTTLSPAPHAASQLDRSMPALDRNQLILLVDDDEQVRGVTATMLAENGYGVVTAVDGQSALDVLEREGERVALVVADYAMPGMTGRQLLDAVRQRRPDVPLLLATGYADYPLLTADYLPIDQIIRKPFRSNELLARIHMVHERRSSLNAAV